MQRMSERKLELVPPSVAKVDRETGWLVYADEQGEHFVNTHEVRATSGAIYSHQWADLCKRAGVTPQHLPVMPRSEKYVTLPEARALVALAREPP